MTAQRRSDPEYMKKYYEANKGKWKLTPEQRAQKNAKRRQRYAEDAEFRDRTNRQVAESRKRHPLSRRAWTYGLSKDEIEFLIDRGCQICHANPHADPTVKMHIDHDHKTGMIRGALCQSCNLALGHMGDDPIRVMAMYDYIMRAASNGSSGADSMTNKMP